MTLYGGRRRARGSSFSFGFVVMLTSGREGSLLMRSALARVLRDSAAVRLSYRGAALRAKQETRRAACLSEPRASASEHRPPLADARGSDKLARRAYTTQATCWPACSPSRPENIPPMKRWLPLLLGPALAVLPAAPAQVPPDKALATFKVSSGLEISLWAAEPLFVNPTCMDIDHKGRVWVCESVNYRTKLGGRPLNRPEGDRILILEDTTGAGKADKVTVFYQSPQTLAPLGIAVAPHPDGPGCTVFVCQSPDILVFEDQDGDGKADGPPRKLLSGFRGYDHDHGVHGILIGPDGKLYFSVGDQGVQGLVDKRGRKWTSNGTDCRAGTNWRCDLDGKNLELLAHNFRNQYEPCMDSFGTMFVSDNDDDGLDQVRICYVMPGGNYGYWPRRRGDTPRHGEPPGGG